MGESCACPRESQWVNPALLSDTVMSGSCILMGRYDVIGPRFAALKPLRGFTESHGLARASYNELGGDLPQYRECATGFPWIYITYRDNEHLVLCSSTSRSLRQL